MNNEKRDELLEENYTRYVAANPHYMIPRLVYRFGFVQGWDAASKELSEDAEIHKAKQEPSDA